MDPGPWFDRVERSGDGTTDSSELYVVKPKKKTCALCELWFSTDNLTGMTSLKGARRALGSAVRLRSQSGVVRPPHHQYGHGDPRRVTALATRFPQLRASSPKISKKRRGGWRKGNRWTLTHVQWIFSLSLLKNTSRLPS